MNYREITLREAIHFKNGKKRPTSEGNIPVYGGNGVLGYAGESNYEHCIIIGRVGAYCGSVYLEEGKCWVSDNAIAAVPSGDNDTKFFYYLLKGLHLNERHIGTSQPLLTQEILNKINCEVPSYPDQQRIAELLSSLDRKINVNRKLNDNLQQQAMALYAEMFLNSSDNNVTTGTLSDIAAITMGQSPSGSSYNEDGVGEVFYQGRAEFGFRFPKRRLFTTEPKRMAETGDVLLSVRAPVGDLNVAYERCCIGRGLGAIHSKTGHSSFVLYTMFALRSQLDVFNGEGTVFGSINRDALNAIPIDIPPVTEIDQFEAVAHPIDELIRANYEENCRLEAIRDSLLPKLMSGEIDVSAVNL